MFNEFEKVMKELAIIETDLPNTSKVENIQSPTGGGGNGGGGATGGGGNGGGGATGGGFSI